MAQYVFSWYACKLELSHCLWLHYPLTLLALLKWQKCPLLLSIPLFFSNSSLPPPPLPNTPLSLFYLQYLISIPLPLSGFSSTRPFLNNCFLSLISLTPFSSPTLTCHYGSGVHAVYLEADESSQAHYNDWYHDVFGFLGEAANKPNLESTATENEEK